MTLEDHLAEAWALAEIIYPVPAPDPEDRETVYDDDLSAREQVAAGATMLLEGDATLDTLAAEYKVAKSRERDAMDRLRGAILVAAEQGMSESEIARRAGVTRMTVRSILGK